MGLSEITGLVGVYHADGGVLGELAYVFGRLRGTAHCGLCDITHRGLGRKQEWDRMVQRLAVPFELVHLNERDPQVRLACGDRTPCVLARTAADFTLLLGPEDLDACAGIVTSFERALRTAVVGHRMSLPGDSAVDSP